MNDTASPAPCPVCGGDVPTSVGRGRPRRFCSPACGREYHRRVVSPTPTPRDVTMIRVRKMDARGNVLSTRYYALPAYAEARARKWAADGYDVAMDATTEPMTFAPLHPMARQSTRVLPVAEATR